MAYPHRPNARGPRPARANGRGLGASNWRAIFPAHTVFARTRGGGIVTHQPMKGVKMVEVAEFTFTPAAGAVLSDWGADVIKVEHAVTGDAQRGLQLGTGGAS